MSMKKFFKVLCPLSARDLSKFRSLNILKRR